MTSTVDTSAALAPAVARFDRQRADARQQRWMAELEQAMLAQQPQAQAQARAPEALLGPAAAPADDGAHKAAETSAAPMRANATAGGSRVRAPLSAPDAARARPGDAQPAEQGKGPGAPAERRAPPSSLATEDTGFAGMTDIGVDVARLDPATALSGTNPMPAVAASIAGEPEGGVAVEPAQTAQTAPVGRLAGAGAAWAGAPLASGEHGMAAEGAATAGAEADAAGDDYEKQLLHLFHGDDGVQAYIRDAELGGARMRAVAQALAVELGAAGTRLAGLTINGRRVSVAGGEGHDEERPATASEAAPLPIIQKGAI